jgi:hypothetical protein
MYSFIELKTLVLSGRDSARSLPLRRGFLLIPLILVCFAFLPQMQAVVPPPDGGYPGFTTAEGTRALESLTTGVGNTGLGFWSVILNTSGNNNTGVGNQSLAMNNGDLNTAVGSVALVFNMAGSENTAVGAQTLPFNNGNGNGAFGTYALFNNATGDNNNAFGELALFVNDVGNGNNAFGNGALLNNTADNLTAVGFLALASNNTAGGSTAFGAGALLDNDTSAAGFPAGFFNNAVGTFALLNNDTGFGNNALGNTALFNNIVAAENTAVGDAALGNNDSTGAGMANNNTAVGGAALLNNVDGSENTAVGAFTGPNIINGFNNTYVGNFIDPGVDEDSTIRINDLSGGDATNCYIGGIFANFQPVGGAIVEVTLDLANDHVGWDVGPSQGAPPAMPRSAPQRRGAPAAPQRPGNKTKQGAMLNDKVDKLQVVVQMQQKMIASLTNQLKEQAAQIQKVSAEVEMMKPAPRVVENR